jgi:hypothetical protein
LEKDIIKKSDDKGKMLTRKNEGLMQLFFKKKLMKSSLIEKKYLPAEDSSELSLRS